MSSTGCTRRTALRLLAQARISGVLGGARVITAAASATNHLEISTNNNCAVIGSSRRYLSVDRNSGDEGDNDDPRLTEWIPPSRPLVGDKGYSHLYPRNNADEDAQEEESEEAELARIEQELKELEENEEEKKESWEELVAEDWVEVKEEWNVDEEDEMDVAIPVHIQANVKTSEDEPDPAPQKMMDWLQTRREKLGDDNTGLTPSYNAPGQDLPVLHHTLLTAEEIMTFLASLGGINPNLITDQVRNEHGDTRMGGAFQGIIFVSGNSPAHLRMLSNSLVDQLKRRKLQEVGVIGARHGAEGSDDPDETWFCIDCHNYIVNIQDEQTRRVLDLETWWSSGNPLAGYNLDTGADDDEAMDNFVARNPVPREYGRSAMVDWNASINQLEHKRWTAPHKTDNEKRRASKGRGGKKKARRR